MKTEKIMNCFKYMKIVLIKICAYFIEAIGIIIGIPGLLMSNIGLLLSDCAESLKDWADNIKGK